eukprot:CAMPEP_0197577636 /NCGR_PEP_ID=MMETSP1326-20131121/2194_1 /TAXON_ID=1155430 /ORGANISM="Genus nov. species nov., Strain RCC2288" /LENGTH=451 /DNA_ID=CAMNT_0043140735 /DNA_START=32 /DNA_END=1387 /DNA_ORIENTATION=+
MTRAHVFVALALALAAVSPCAGSITKDNIVKDDRAIVLIARPFGFDPDGLIEISIKEPKVFLFENAPPADKTKLGFFITTSEAETQLQQYLADGGCVLDNPTVDKLFTFQDMENNRNEAGEYRYTNTIAPEKAGEYSLFFSNCEPNTVVSFDITVELSNKLPSGKKDFLSAGEKPLPTLYLVAFFCYLSAGITWVWCLWRARQATEGGVQSVHKIHFLMGVLIAFKCLTVLCQSGMYHLIRTRGDPEGWNIAYYFFTSMRGLFLFTVVVLIGTGWSFLKPFLNDREKKVLMVVIPLQVFANIATIVLDQSGPAIKGWFTWRDIFHLLDIICCCAILFPIVWSIKHLREAASTDGKKVRNMNKLILFRQFYVMVVAYIYFTRIVVYLLKSTAQYTLLWLSDAASELATLSFYCVTGWMFRPVVDNPYLHLEEDEMDRDDDGGVEMVSEGRNV